MRKLLATLGLMVVVGCGSDEGVQSATGGSGGVAASGATGGQAGAGPGGTAGASSGGTGSTAGSGGVGGAGGMPSQLCTDACNVFQTCDSALDVGSCNSQCELEVAGTGYLSQELALRFFNDVVATGSDTGCDLTRSNRWWVVLTETAGFASSLTDQQTFETCRSSMVCSRTEPELSAICLLRFYRYNDAIREESKKCFPLCSSSEPETCFSKAAPPGQPWIAGVSPL